MDDLIPVVNFFFSLFFIPKREDQFSDLGIWFLLSLFNVQVYRYAWIK